MLPIQSALYENEPSRNVTYSKCIIRKWTLTKCYLYKVHCTKMNLDEMLTIQSALYENQPRQNVTIRMYYKCY